MSVHKKALRILKLLISRITGNLGTEAHSTGTRVHQELTLARAGSHPLAAQLY